jgi:predicted acetyltransferase
VAYGIASQSKIAEIGAFPEEEEALLDVFDALVAGVARTERSTHIGLDVPVDHPLVCHLPEVLKSPVPCGMLLVTDLRRLLAELGPELETRARGTREGQARLESPVGSARLTWEDGRVVMDDSADGPAARLTPGGIASLLLGFQSAADLCASGEIEADDDTLGRLSELFPGLNSHFWELDHF